MATLKERIKNRDVRIGVVGLGYVGLPMVRLFASKQFKTTGFDIDEKKIHKLRRGQSYIKSFPSETVAEMMREGWFTPTSDFSRLRDMDAIIICVPTPLTVYGEPDLSYIRSTGETIMKTLRKGQIVVLESTTYPGTTREVLLPMLEKKGFKPGRDCYLAFAPEREDPGNKHFTSEDIPKIVGGIEPRSLDMAATLYEQVIRQVVRVSSCEVAEAAKLLENIYRCVNIALVNELKTLLTKMGINIWEVVGAAATKPFGFHPFYPGPGMGGHCIPVDPFYLSWKALEYQTPTRFIQLAGEINVQMPHYVVSRTREALKEAGKTLKGAKILVLGLAYKKDIDDPRESPAFKVIEILQGKGARVSYNDPLIPFTPEMRHYGVHMKSAALTEKLLRAQDAVVIVTDHSAYDYDRIVKHSRLVIDTRNATKDVKSNRRKIVLA